MHRYVHTYIHTEDYVVVYIHIEPYHISYRLVVILEKSVESWLKSSFCKNCQGMGVLDVPASTVAFSGTSRMFSLAGIKPLWLWFWFRV